MAFKDYFSKQSDIYAKARPGYPDELFGYLSSLCKEKDTVWDCATGNGQAATSLAKFFKKVIATDASEQQLLKATKMPNITYKMALAEESGIETNSIDLITVANAIHWFNRDAFYKEADRVLKVGGVLAAWTYEKSYIDGPDKEKIGEVVGGFAHGTLENYWPDETRLAQRGYREIKLPFTEIETPRFVYKTEVSMEKLLGFMYSWSSTQLYINRVGEDPVIKVKNALRDVWGGENTRPMVWELALKVSRK